MKYDCEDLAKAARRDTGVEPTTSGCRECLLTGEDWVHLRLCLTCGHVGCCDDSPSRHARKHFHQTLHRVIRSFEPGETWAYCFADDTLAADLPAPDEAVAPVHYAARW